MSIKEFINYAKEVESFDWTQVSTPLSDLLAKKEDGKIIILEYEITNLWRIEKIRRDQIFSSYEIFRSKENKNEYILECTGQNLAEKLLDFILALYEVNYFI